MGFTTIQVSSETLERLKSAKTYPRESYDEVINKTLDDIEEGELTDEAIADIKEGLDDIKAGRTHTIEAVAKELGVKLK